MVRSIMIRHLRLHVIGVFVTLALVGVVMLDNAWHRGITTTPTADPIPAAETAFLGVNLFNIQYEPDPAVVERSFAEAQRLGARYARIQMPWEDVEIHGRGDFEDRRNPEHIRNAWEKYDAIVAMAARYDIQLIVRIDRPPLWARATSAATPKFQAGLQENGDSTGPPDDYQDYANFVAAVAARYPQVTYIQIWNEPNLAYEWNWEFPDPEAFTRLLTMASTAARQANPNVQILFPSLSPTDGKEPRIAPMSELDFLARCYAAGARDAFDIMSAQAYGLGQPPDEHRYVRLRWNPLRPWAELDRPIDSRIDVSRIVMLREVMQAAGDEETAVWISEFGYNSAPDSIPAERRFVWGPPVTEVEKGDYVVGQMERARTEWPWIGVMNLWMLRWGGPPADPANPTPYFAVLAPDFTPYPGFATIQQATSTPLMGAGAHLWSHPAVRTNADGTTMLRVHGTQIALRGAQGAVIVTVDQQSPVTVTLTGDDDVVVSGLNDAVHTVTISGLTTPPTAVLVWRQQPWRFVFALLPVIGVVGLSIILYRLWAPSSTTESRITS
jgi:hypothetical protein